MTEYSKHILNSPIPGKNQLQWNQLLGKYSKIESMALSKLWNKKHKDIGKRKLESVSRHLKFPTLK